MVKEVRIVPTFLRRTDRMKRVSAVLLLLLLLCLSGMALAGEGDPLLSVDELISLESGYRGFLDSLADLLIGKDLLMPDEKDAWIALQMGDFLSNGGYGSILTAFYPGILDYAQEEEQILELTAPLENGTVSLMTMKRYRPMDSMSDGLMMLFSLDGPDGQPVEARFELTATDGVLYRWDAAAGSYLSVGMTAEVTGETVFWGCPVPVDGSVAPVMHVRVYTADTDIFQGMAVFQMEIDRNSYLASQENFLTEQPEDEQAVPADN